MSKHDGGKHFNTNADKTLPMNKDSCFGDFPTANRVKSKALLADPTALNLQEASIAINAKRK